MNPEPMPAIRGPQLLTNGLSGVHKSFADYMLINPGATLREMGAFFGYSGPWICTVINSDMFKTYFEQRRGQIDVAVAQDLPSKLKAAAHLATERLIEVIEKSEDADTLIDAFDKVLHRCGYAPSAKAAPAGVTNNTQNVFYLNKDELATARQQLLANHTPMLSAPIEAEKVG